MIYLNQRTETEIFMKKLLKLTVILLMTAVLCIAFSACSDEHKHKLTYHGAVEPKCNVEGNVEYWECGDCNKKFLDEAATKEAKKPSELILEMTDCNFRGCVCTDCGSGEHVLKYYQGILPSCYSYGLKEHWLCHICELKFSDSEANAEITDVVIEPIHVGGSEVRDKVTPTDEHEGYTGNTYCLGCDSIISVGSSIPKLDHVHSIVHYPKVNATCTTDGNVEYWACTRCLKKYSDVETVTEISEVVIKGSHSISLVSATEPTCLSEGNEAYYQCSKCGNSYYDEKGNLRIRDLSAVLLPNVPCYYSNSICIWCRKHAEYFVPSLAVADDSYLIITGIDEYYGNDIVIEKSYGGLPVKEIADGAFAYCTDITTVTLPDGIVRIGEEAFAGCTSLVSINLPKSLYYIEDNAFSGCHKLFEVINRSSLTVLPGRTAYGMVGYYAKTIHSEKSKITQSGDFLFGVYGGVNYLLGYKGDEAIVELPISFNGSRYRIYKYAFAYNTDIISINIPYYVSGIDSNAFVGCSRIVEVINKSALKIKIGDSDNGGIAAFALEVHSGAGKTAVKDGFVFYTVNEENYLVGYQGFEESITLPSSYNGKAYAVYNGAFANCHGLISVNTGGATALGDRAFYGCRSLRTVVLNTPTKAVGSSAFQCCTALETVTIRGTVTSIGSNVFYMCGKLKSKPF